LSRHLFAIRSRSILARHPETRGLVTKEFKFPIEDDAAHIDAALKWFAWAIDSSSDDGVVHGVDLTTFALTGRLDIAPSYPETSGYILCTLVYGVRSRLPSLPGASLERLSKYLVAKQTPSGGIPGPRKDKRALSFDTGQVLAGLTSYYKHIAADDEVRQAVEHAADWMCRQIEPDGSYSIASCYNGQRTYYVQATIGLFHAAQCFDREDWLEAVVRNVNWAYRRHRGDGWFDTISFEDRVEQSLHGIAYTLRGMIELGYRLKRPELIDCGRIAIDAMNRNYTDLPGPGGIPGYFANGFDQYLRTISPTGMSQIAICSYMLSEITKDTKYREFGDRLVNCTKAMQFRGFSEAGLNGGLPGSWPVTGPYENAYIPSWPLKFFLDALYIKSGADPMAMEG